MSSAHDGAARPQIEPSLTANARQVLTARYLRREGGTIVETPAELFTRVARYVAAVERNYSGKADAWEDMFYEAMARLEFLPNSPVLMNAGTPMGQLAACFVLPLDDTLESIFRTLHDSALIHQTGGGVGYDFSRLRPAGDPVASTGGVSSGPVSFMHAFDAAVDAVRQGGRRRGANMGVLDVHHPDVETFIRAKEDPARLRNFNLSVAVDDAFMRAAANGHEIALMNPRTGVVAGRRDAAALLRLIASCAWQTGDPGLIFIDRISRDNPTPSLGRITSTNPCGEVPLLPYEACILGSINLSSLSTTGSFDWGRLDRLAALGTRFLDDCVDASVFPLPETARAAHASRKIGLGVMGLADALVDLGIPYDDEQALAFAGAVLSRMASVAADTSRELARDRGAYPSFESSRDAAAGRPPIRNATRLAVAPTGTLSLIAGCSSGIEPLYAIAYERHVLEGKTLVEVNTQFERRARERGIWNPALQAVVVEHGRVRDRDEVPSDLRRLFPTAHEVSPAWHIRMQAACQEHVDNAVSKTVNLAADATVEDVAAAYRSAFELGCKGVTVYRHGSKGEQVLRPITPTLCGACGGGTPIQS